MTLNSNNDTIGELEQILQNKYETTYDLIYGPGFVTIPWIDMFYSSVAVSFTALADHSNYINAIINLNQQLDMYFFRAETGRGLLGR